MRLTCGCMEPDDDHGDPEYLTLAKFARIAKKDDLTVEQADENLRKALQVTRKQKKGAH